MGNPASAVDGPAPALLPESGAADGRIAVPRVVVVPAAGGEVRWRRG